MEKSASLPFPFGSDWSMLGRMDATTPREERTDWTPHEQRWRECTGHMEREERRLQLRVDLHLGEEVCNVIFEEDEDSVSVLILVCGERGPKGELVNCPTHIYLARPLGERAVLDMLRGRRPVPYVNVWEEMERDGLLRKHPSGNGWQAVP